MDDNSKISMANKAQDLSRTAYAKAMELIALMSGSTIGLIVAFRHQANSNSLTELKVVLIALFVAILSVIIWFFSRAKGYIDTSASIILNKEEVVHSTKEPLYGRICRIIAISAFVFAYILLYLLI